MNRRTFTRQITLGGFLAALPFSGSLLPPRPDDPLTDLRALARACGLRRSWWSTAAATPAVGRAHAALALPGLRTEPTGIYHAMVSDLTLIPIIRRDLRGGLVDVQVICRSGESLVVLHQGEVRALRRTARELSLAGWPPEALADRLLPVGRQVAGGLLVYRTRRGQISLVTQLNRQQDFQTEVILKEGSHTRLALTVGPAQAGVWG